MAYADQSSFGTSPVGQWIMKHLMTSNPNFAPPSYTGPDWMRQNPSNSGLPAVSIGGDRKTPQMAQPESGTPYPQAPQMPDQAQIALAQKLLTDNALRDARRVPPRGQMVQPESGTPQPQYQPPAPRQQMVQPESGTPWPQQAPAQQARVPTPPPRSDEFKQQGKNFWLDKGDGSPLMPYYSKTGEKPNLPGMTSFEDPNYKPFLQGLFGS